MDYNPNRPYILGEEWVGIRDENLVFSEAVNASEFGHTFVTPYSGPVQDMRFYINDFTSGPFNNQAYTASLYRSGQEAESGPIRRVVIPCNAGGVTGASILFPATTVAQAVANRGSHPTRGVTVDGTSGTQPQVVSFSFAVNQYPVLNAKRILAVNALMQYRVRAQSSAAPDGSEIFYELNNVVDVTLGVAGFQFSDLANGEDPPQGTRVNLTTRIGDVALLTNVQSPARNSIDIYPWNYAELQRFEQSSANRMHLLAYCQTSGSVGPIVTINYMALEVFFCEETRVAFGTKLFNSFPAQTAFQVPMALGANPITMRTLAGVQNVAIPSGSYTMTISQASMGDNIEALSNPVEGAHLNALRELYSLSNFDGVLVKLPQQLTELQVGEQALQRSTYTVLPQLSLHTTGGTLTDTHVYGRQAQAQVYAAVTATQILRDDFGAAATYPQVRFWARRFGATASPLVLTQVTGGASVQITPAEHDLLPEILDGWKEVTLRFSAPPTMGNSTFPAWQFSDATDLAGSRWEVLAVAAPAFSGTPGNNLNEVTAVHRLNKATYGAPAGDTYALTYQSPAAINAIAISGSALDVATDACMLFSQDPPTITTLVLNTLSQALTGVTTDCSGQTPCCIPSAISYNRLTWTPPVTGYGSFSAIEMQRFDTVDGSFKTIMSCSATGVTGFSDYEARVGVPSVYRIRALNTYRFAGAWSAQVTGTITAPGLTVSCTTDNNNGVLIFTSNEAQSGSSNLAYAMQFDRGVDEGFTYLEADTRQLRRHYQRNFMRAYRPTERGGEAFDRLLLLSAVAGALPNMANMTSLRNLAWQDLTYVCVRDSLGNRWFANVNVPSGVITQRAVYVAQVAITETNEDPSQVDPR